MPHYVLYSVKYIDLVSLDVPGLVLGNSTADALKAGAERISFKILSAFCSSLCGVHCTVDALNASRDRKNPVS